MHVDMNTREMIVTNAIDMARDNTTRSIIFHIEHYTKRLTDDETIEDDTSLIQKEIDNWEMALFVKRNYPEFSSE